MSTSFLCMGCICEFIKEHYIISFILIVYLLNQLLSLFKKGKSIRDEVVFVTGGASGIGRQMCLQFAAQGAKVIIADIDTVRAKQLAQEITESKQQAMWIHCDVTSVESVNAAADSARSKFGSPTILINNAGIISGKPITELSIENIERTFKVNAISHFYTIKALLPDMLKADKGHIVTIASIAGIGGVSKMTDYCASKFAAVGIDDSLRNELKMMGSKVKTTCVCPYFINTGMFKGVSTSFTFLFPMLNEDWVAGRIIKAVKYDEPLLLMPKTLILCVILKGLLPVHLLDFLGSVLGFQKSMETFIGRH